MITTIRLFPLILSFAFLLNACADDEKRIEEPLEVDHTYDDPVSSDEEAVPMEDSDESVFEPLPQNNFSDDAESEEHDGALSEQDGAMPQAAPSEKGGIISSGVKEDKKRCRLITDELERRKCLREQAK